MWAATFLEALQDPTRRHTLFPCPRKWNNRVCDHAGKLPVLHPDRCRSQSLPASVPRNGDAFTDAELDFSPCANSDEETHVDPGDA